jgi:hypothetical protein
VWEGASSDAKSTHFTKGLVCTFDEYAAVNSPKHQRLEEICDV